MAMALCHSFGVTKSLGQPRTRAAFPFAWKPRPANPRGASTRGMRGCDEGYTATLSLIASLGA
jgi:hypothetical protein